MSEKPASFAFEDNGDIRRFAPATLRNRDAIAAVLQDILPHSGQVLEIASGTGEHIVHFARIFPSLGWQPSDPDPPALASINAWRAWEGEACNNVYDALQIDAAAAPWPLDYADAILCINMIHIAPWKAAIGLMEGAAGILPSGAPLYLYGPYRENGLALAESNAAFDRSLKERNPEWGLRLLEDVAKLAENSGIYLERRIEMPANNLSLVFRKS